MATIVHIEYFMDGEDVGKGNRKSHLAKEVTLTNIFIK
jgi:hypothetical protein